MYICIYTNCDVIYTIHVTLCLLSNMVCDIDIEETFINVIKTVR